MTTEKEILAACEERIGDLTQLLVAADWMAEHNEPVMEAALRWMAKWQKWPKLLTPDDIDEIHPPDRRTTSPVRHFMWTCYGGLCGPRFNDTTAHALPRELCKPMKYVEWKCYQSWTKAVEALAAALKVGDVECVGDPTIPEGLSADEEAWLRNIEL